MEDLNPLLIYTETSSFLPFRLKRSRGIIDIFKIDKCARTDARNHVSRSANHKAAAALGFPLPVDSDACAVKHDCLLCFVGKHAMENVIIEGDV